MYKIYINVSELFLIDENDKYKFLEPINNTLLINYHGRSNSLMNYVDLLEKSKTKKIIVIISKDMEQLKKDFKSIFTIIRASGGVVRNENNEILFIYRKGWWDLPKGKIEKGEGKKEAAVREVEEETGVKNLIIENRIGKTRHFYRTKSGKKMLKISYWYSMEAKNQSLVPQLEEDIEQAVWMTKKTFLSKNYKIYNSLIGLIDTIS